MRIVVVGGGGFVGQHVVEELVRRGHEVVAVTRRAVRAAWPEGVTHRVLDAQHATDGEVADLLVGGEGVVFAAGVDDRTLVPAPAYPVLHAANVVPVVRLVSLGRAAGVKRVVVLGSYFTHFTRRWPELELPERHPYIRSRVEQVRAAMEAAGSEVRVTVLELPFIFGAASGLRSQWVPLVAYAASRLPLVAPEGGTAAVAVEQVAEAVAGGLERDGEAAGGCHPVVEENLRWGALLERLARVTGRPRSAHRLPSGVLRAAMPPVGLVYRVKGLEPGLETAGLPSLFLRELFLDPTSCREVLGVQPRELDAALEATVAACDVPASG
ncbi:NAD-dependent epimerase/dehydratase family protein [Chondromyces crocatus]|uniref:Nucleoside-diphosphate-sugar epimerase n=1 Tax=Chondromyces crocatus TaxID=52 RepID=A0A0K1EAI1_CHOCO|nr:NAD-dependent epimerase/dehydratase family protein [Chondromyces crocatus]AKT37568.1 nucleoside-diphosphate-sugar epimerase [Chondromyces crocatus]